MTVRADRAAQRGVRTGFSQSQPLSQNIQDLPEDEDEKLPESPEVDEDESSLQVERGDTIQSVEMVHGSGIGIFSQEGMVRVGRLDTDSDSELGGGVKGMDDEGSSIYHSFQPTVSDLCSTDAVTGNDSDRSFMSVQEGMMDTTSSSKSSSKDALVPGAKAVAAVAASDDAVAATAISGNSRDTRSESDSDDDAHLSKKARTKA